MAFHASMMVTLNRPGGSAPTRGLADAICRYELFAVGPDADGDYVAPSAWRTRKISRCCSFAPGDPDPLLPVFSVASSNGVEPLLFGARGSAPPLMRELTEAVLRLRTAR